MTRPYQIVPLAERTVAWWEWRRHGIGSADAASILGLKPAKSVDRLLLEKSHPPQNPARTFAREQGAALERAARAHFCEAIGVTVTPACVQSIQHPWQRASLDGLSADGAHVVEIKCGLAAYQRAVARRRPPSNHYAQLQHILSVTDLGSISYWCYVPRRTPVHLEVQRDDAYIERLFVAEEIFWRRLASQ